MDSRSKMRYMPIEDFPKKAYKYMEAKWLKKLMRDKKLFVNHLNNYPESSLGADVGDDQEGVANRHLNIKKYKTGDHNPHLHNELQEWFPDSIVRLEDVSFQTSIINKNFYVYCLTFNYDKNIMRKFGGSVMVINDFPSFAYWVHNKMKKRNCALYAANNCIYRESRSITFNEENTDFYLVPGLIKDSKHSEQEEFRFLWRKNDNSLINRPINDLYVPEALKFCSFEINE
ncbi:hypothetical protein [Bacillus velezensis]|uniref:hypothetical protein n=1 Tax=Bacillus velezensis TaxID=492670 RepID=UPI000D3AD121|nr:hypothetical protein [Bacillus velezensis]